MQNLFLIRACARLCAAGMRAIRVRQMSPRFCAAVHLLYLAKASLAAKCDVAENAFLHRSVPMYLHVKRQVCRTAVCRSPCGPWRQTVGTALAFFCNACAQFAVEPVRGEGKLKNLREGFPENFARAVWGVRALAMVAVVSADGRSPVYDTPITTRVVEVVTALAFFCNACAQFAVEPVRGKVRRGSSF